MRRFAVTRRGATLLVRTPLGVLELAGAEALVLARDLQEHAGKAAMDVVSRITVVDAVKAIGALAAEVRKAKRRRR